MMVPVYNLLRVPNKVEGTLINPQQWGEVPFEDALRYRNCPGLVFDWKAVEANAMDWVDQTRHISILSPFNPYDGYGLVGIHSVLGLESRGIGVHISNGGMPFRGVLEERYPGVMDVYRRKAEFTRWGLCHIQPKEFHQIHAARKIAWTMWEATHLPRSWTEYFALVERLIVPTKGQVGIFRNSGIGIPIDVIPDGIDFGAFTYKERPERKTFTFITWGRLSSRKCPMETASCFLQAFPKDKYPDVRLIFKTRDGYMGGGPDQIPTFRDDRISVVDSEWRVGQLVRFCHDADAAIFLSHGEGFGQPAVQAMATGLPVILSNHSGQSDFCNERYNYPIRTSGYSKSPLGSEYGEPDQLEWWDSDYQEVVERMREVYHDRDRAREKGKKAAVWVRKKFSIDVMVDELAKLIKGLD